MIPMIVPSKIVLIICGMAMRAVIHDVSDCDHFAVLLIITNGIQ